MLAGRKLLLADDSSTIQKVVALTFADEGVEVVTVSDGRKAIEHLQGSIPDIVLADVFMPEINGYEVCRYIKQNAKLKHIPVMLLVGSFEPFDEAEARRVGADDILTKPFQSIRRLIDKVGALVGIRPPEEATTAELPPVKEEDAQPEKLSTADLEITTADTQPLPLAEKHPDYPAHISVAAVEEPETQANIPAGVVEQPDYRSGGPVKTTPLPQDVRPESFRESQSADSSVNELRNEDAPDFGDALLDLGDLGRTSTAASDDFVLDLDFDEPPQAAQPLEAAAASGTHSIAETQLSRRGDSALEVTGTDSSLSTAWMDTADLAYRQQGKSSTSEESVAAPDQKFVDTQEWERESLHSTPDDLQSTATGSGLERAADQSGNVAHTARAMGPVTLDQLSPEVIDAIARRAVEQLSDRVIREIAWEVVPELAELLIKRKLEETQSQTK